MDSIDLVIERLWQRLELEGIHARLDLSDGGRADDDAAKRRCVFVPMCLITSSTTTLFPPRVTGVLLLENNDDLGEEKEEDKKDHRNKSLFYSPSMLCKEAAHAGKGAMEILGGEIELKEVGVAKINVEKMTVEEMEWMMGINVYGVLNGTQA